MYRNFFTFCLLVMLTSSIGMRANNTVTIESVSGSPGSTVTVSVSIKNTDAISAMQVQIPMPDNCTLVEGTATASARASAHSVAAGVRNDTLNLFVYSPSMAAINGNSGEVMAFQLHLGNQPSEEALDVLRLILTDSSGKRIAGTATGGTVTVSAAKAEYNTSNIDFGRIPIHGTYTRELTINNVGNDTLKVTALSFSAEELSSGVDLPFNIYAGSNRTITLKYAPTKRGSINETLRVVCNSSSKLNAIKITAQPYAVNELHIDDVEGIADSTVTIHLRVNNMDSVNGFQFEFNLPKQLKYVDGSFTLSPRKTDHQSVASLHGDTLRLIAYSLNNRAFTGYNGEIASFDVRLHGRSGTTISPYKAMLIANINDNAEDVLSDKYDGYINISSPQLSTDSLLDMGSTPITKEAIRTIDIHNNGSAPLIISRVEFDTLSFVIRENLPITIEPLSSKQLTVVYNGLNQQEFKSIMQLYCNDPEQQVWKVNITGSRFAPNYLSMDAPNICIGDTLNVNVSLNNYDPINGIQFDLDYPGQYFTPVERISSMARAKGLLMQIRKLESGTYRFFVYSQNDVSISPDTGMIFTFCLSPNGKAPVGDYTLKITHIKLGTPELTNKYSGKDLTVNFKVTLRDQTVNWLQKDTALLVGDSCMLEARSSASLPVTYTVIEGASLVQTSVSDGKLRVYALKSGNVKVVAIADEDSIHHTASNTCNIVINKKGQNITWEQDTAVYVGSSLKLTAIASTNGLINYEIVSGSENGEIVADSTGFSLKGIKAGNVTIMARQAGNNTYESVGQSKQFLILGLEEQVINWTQQTERMVVGDSCILEAQSSTFIPVTYSVTNGADLIKVLETEGKLKVTALASGLATVTATCEGDATHAPASSVLNIVIEEDTGINTINVDSHDGYWYTLDGTKLTRKPIVTGVYIHNKKKVTIKNGY